MRRLFVLFFAAATGYVSLSQEMLWMRLVSYMTGGRPSVFAHVLGFFLVGVALGAFYGEKLCERRFAGGKGSPVRFIGLMLTLSALFYYGSIAVTAELFARSAAAGLLATHGVVAAVSFLLGGIFPVLCHYAARAGESVGITVSRIYLANIVGSTAGPLLTGFVLMQYFPTDRIILHLSIGTLILGGLAMLYEARRWAPAAVVGAVALWMAHPWAYDRLLEKLLNPDFGHAVRYKHLVQTRSGIVSVTEDPLGGPDIIYGGGIYDGRFNVDPMDDSNGIRRAYRIASLHPNPREVLEVGLSSGSWSRVLTAYEPVQRSVIIEINPGYLDVVRHYPLQAELLSDPRVTIHFDDGRRWLNRHPEASFDFILQNTTWHWRSSSTNLLSQEYLELTKSHLKPGGVVYFNTTGLHDAAYTAARVFRHVVRFRRTPTDYESFVAASDWPFNVTPQEARANLARFSFNGRPAFPPGDAEYREILEQLAGHPLEDEGEALRAATHLHLITDDNMYPEYKAATWYDGRKSWAGFFQRRRDQSP